MALREAMPWIYYQEDPLTLLRSSLPIEFKLKTSFSEDTAAYKVQYLTFNLAEYHMNGTFIGYRELKNQLSVCDMSFDDVLTMRKFGAQMSKECMIDLAILKDKDPGNLMLEEANVFYELYLVDSFGQMIDIPVLIRNYQSGTEGNIAYPNAEGTDPVSTWKLVRRFFVVDSISGVEESKPMTEPAFIRYASKISLKVMMDKEA